MKYIKGQSLFKKKNTKIEAFYFFNSMVTNYNGTTLPDKYNLNLFIY